VFGMSFVADREPSVTGEPGEGAFDLPSVPAETIVAVDAAASDPRHDPALAQPAAVSGGVVPLVGAQATRFASSRSTAGLDRGNGVEHRAQHGAVVGVRCRDADDQRNSLGFGQDVDLRPLLAAVDRAGTGQRYPLFARTLAASRIAADQSSSPEPPSRSSTSRCRFSNTPARTQAVKRRWAVGTVTPNDGGRCRQAQPLVNTNTIAVNTARSSIGALPPPCGRDAKRGMSGSAISHNASGTKRRDSSSTTDHIMHHNPLRPHETRSKGVSPNPR